MQASQAQCPNCRAYVSSAAKFCNQCGVRFVIASQQPVHPTTPASKGIASKIVLFLGAGVAGLLGFCMLGMMVLGSMDRPEPPVIPNPTRPPADVVGGGGWIEPTARPTRVPPAPARPTRPPAQPTPAPAAAIPEGLAGTWISDEIASSYTFYENGSFERTTRHQIGSGGALECTVVTVVQVAGTVDVRYDHMVLYIQGGERARKDSCYGNEIKTEPVEAKQEQVKLGIDASTASPVLYMDGIAYRQQ